MMIKPNVQCFLILVCLLVGVSFSAVEFIMLSPSAVDGETTLDVGQEAVIQILAKFDVDPPAGNGVTFWELDMILEDPAEDGVVGIKMNEDDPVIDIFLPDQSVITSGLLSPNDPVTGAGEDLGIFSIPHFSNVAIGGYSLLAEVTIVALAEGTVDYELGNFSVGGNDNGSGAELSGYFNEDGSDTVFTVVPEPASLLLLAGMGMLARVRRS